MALLAALAITALACNGDDGPTPSATSTLQLPTDAPPATGAGGTIPAVKGWRTLASMPTPRSEVAAAVVGGKIYVVGGFLANGSPSDAVEVYDPATDTWEQAPPLPEPRHHAGALGYEDTLMVIGGFGTGFDDPKDTVFQFDEPTASWTEGPRLVTPRGGLAVASFAGNPVAVGGLGKGDDGSAVGLASIEILIYEEGWRDLERPMAVARDHLAAASVTLPSLGDVLVDHLFAIGGRRNVDFGQNLDANESSLVLSGGWTNKAALPTPRSGIAAAEINARIYVFGGEGSSGTFDENEAYDPATDTWQTLEPMPTARHGLGAAVIGDTIYVIGGGETPGLSVSGANQAFTP